MAKHGGFPGGMPGMNMNNIMKQYQRMQRKLEEMGRRPASRHDRHAGSIAIRSHIAFIPQECCREYRDGDGCTDTSPLFFQ